MHASDDTILFAPNSPAAAYLDDFTAEFAPNTPAEAALVRQLALCTARADLLDRALDAFPRLNQRRALVDCLQEQYDVFGPSANLKDQPEWSAALRRYDGCPSTYPRDPAPAADPDLAACTLVYSLTSPRYGRLLRQHAQAGRGFSAALRDLQGLQAGRPKAATSYASAPPHLQSIGDLLQRGWQLTPPEGARSIGHNEPNPRLFTTRTDLAHPEAQNEPDFHARAERAHPNAQNEANSVPDPSWAGHPAMPGNLEGPDLPHVSAELRNEPDSAPTPLSTSPAAGTPSREYEPNRAPDPTLSIHPNIPLSDENEPDPAPTHPSASPAAGVPTPDRTASVPPTRPRSPRSSHTTVAAGRHPAVAEGPARPQSAVVLAMRPQSQARPPDLALLDRLTQHTAQPISEAEWLAIACRPPAGGISVEDEIAALRVLAGKVSGRRASPPVSL